MIQFQENVWTEGQTLFHSTVPATAGRPKNNTNFSTTWKSQYFLNALNDSKTFAFKEDNFFAKNCS